MQRREFFQWLALPVGTTLWPACARAQSAPAVRKPDLADIAEGTYLGDVISDSKGASQSGVTLTVTRIRKDAVRVTSDYPRLPAVEVTLTGAMGKILQRNGDTVFLLDPRSAHLDVSFMNEVSWSGSRR